MLRGGAACHATYIILLLQLAGCRFGVWVDLILLLAQQLALLLACGHLLAHKHPGSHRVEVGSNLAWGAAYNFSSKFRCVLSCEVCPRMYASAKINPRPSSPNAMNNLPVAKH